MTILVNAKLYILMASMLSLAMHAGAAGARDILIDDFEDGTDAGWRVVGHGPLMRSYHKRLVSPGSDGSAFALRLTRETKAGWCGLGIDHLDRLGMRAVAAIRLSARNAGGVRGILVDAQCSDGSRWWCKLPLRPGGEWTPISVPPARFFPVKNPHHRRAPDLARMQALWLTMDALDPTPPARGAWALEVDDVRLAGELRTQPPRAEAALTAPPPPRWSGPAIRVGVVDCDSLPPCGRIPGLARAVAVALRRAGLSAVRRIEPGTLAAEVAADAPDVLVMTGPGYALTDAPAVIAHLKRGNALWLISAAPIFSRPMRREPDGTWRAVPAAAPPPLLERILGVPAGMPPGSGQQSIHPLALDRPVFELTPAGRTLWPFLPAALPAVKCGYLAADDSTCRPCFPPWVTVTPLLRFRYVKKNWIGQKDRFTGWPMALLSHHAGPFAGARILFSGLSNDPQSMVAPGNPAFGAVVVACLRRLGAPAARRSLDAGASPRSGLPALTRANYLDYPGAVFLPIRFGGGIPEDPNFQDDMRCAGFAAILIGIPWLEKPAGPTGAVIDWRVTDRAVTAAAKHGARAVFDPYNFNWGRFRGWTGVQSIHNPLFRDRFARAMQELAGRYARNPTVVALYATPWTGTYGFRVDRSAQGRAAWRRFARTTLDLSLAQAGQRYGAPLKTWNDLPLPAPNQAEPFNIGTLRADYLRFHNNAYDRFMRQVIHAIRRETPDMPILLRGPYFEVSINMRLAAAFRNVAPHCECVETTVDVEGYFRSLGLRFGVPISAENGWPKSRGGPLRMALADYLLGGYADFQYSFDGPSWARPSVLDFRAAARAARVLRGAGARYPRADLALLIPDTTLWASRPPNFFSMEGKPHIEFFMERLGFPFEGVSAQYPRLDGLRILIDDGGNRVLTAACRDALAAWVRAGGTLVVFPHTGEYTLEGGGPTLATALGLVFTVQPGRVRETFRVGKGRVVLLPAVPGGKDRAGIDRFEKLLVRLGAARPVEIQPRVNNACFEAGDKTYVVLYNKSRKYVGAFFRESTLPAVERALPDLVLTLRPHFRIRGAMDVGSGTRLEVRNGEVRVALPATRWKVIELAR